MLTRSTPSHWAHAPRPHSRWRWEAISHEAISELFHFPGRVDLTTHPTLPTSSACRLWTTLRSCLSVSTEAWYGRRPTPSGRFPQVSLIRLQSIEGVWDCGRRHPPQERGRTMMFFFCYRAEFVLSRDSVPHGEIYMIRVQLIMKKPNFFSQQAVYIFFPSWLTSKCVWTRASTSTLFLSPTRPRLRICHRTWWSSIGFSSFTSKSTSF